MTTPTSPRRAAIVAALPLLLVGSACAGGANSSQAGADATPDDGAQLTMWVRSATDEFSQRLVAAYNKSHKNQVKLTIIPNDSYLQKVGAAAGANSLPDIVAADVVYSPNYTKQGLFVDITDRVKALPFASSLAQAPVRAATDEGKIYGVPHKVDSSALFYNKDLFKRAGLNPDKAPVTFDDIYNDAKAVNGLDGGVQGFYFAGNCGGCISYTAFPHAWAAGSDVISTDGRTADVDNDGFKATFALYKRMYDEGLVASSAKTEDGSTWADSFAAGKVGIVMNGSPLINTLQKVKFDWGVAPLRSPDGSTASTFVGGDVAGISRSSKHVAQAWDFLSWTLGKDAQVEIIAKNGDLPDRTDLVDNPYTSKDPRTKLLAAGLKNGRTPATLPYGELFNDPNGPWVTAFRAAIFASSGTALADAQTKIQAKLDSAN